MEKDINIHNMYVVRLSKIFIKIVYLLLFIGYADEKKIYRKKWHYVKVHSVIFVI